MSWKQAAAFLTVVFVITVIQTAIAGPLVTLQDTLINAVDFGSPHFNGASLIRGIVSSWFQMGLVAIFGLMLVAIARVVRRELTRQGRQP